ncbi:MAG: PTS sugar transporter subunit IIA [Gemmatimonadaceae bacterium]
MLLSELLSAGRVKVPLGGRTKNEVFRELVDLVARTHDGVDADAVLASVHERERCLSTGIGGGIAIPHGRTPDLVELVLAAGVATGGIEYDAADGKPVRLVFMLVGPENASGAHVKALSRIARLLRQDRLRDELMRAPSAEAFLTLIRAAEAV